MWRLRYRATGPLSGAHQGRGTPDLLTNHTNTDHLMGAATLGLPHTGAVILGVPRMEAVILGVPHTGAVILGVPLTVHPMWAAHLTARQHMVDHVKARQHMVGHVTAVGTTLPPLVPLALTHTAVHELRPQGYRAQGNSQTKSMTCSSLFRE